MPSGERTRCAASPRRGTEHRGTLLWRVPGRGDQRGLPFPFGIGRQRKGCGAVRCHHLPGSSPHSVGRSRCAGGQRDAGAGTEPAGLGQTPRCPKRGAVGTWCISHLFQDTPRAGGHLRSRSWVFLKNLLCAFAFSQCLSCWLFTQSKSFCSI